MEKERKEKKGTSVGIANKSETSPGTKEYKRMRKGKGSRGNIERDTRRKGGITRGKGLKRNLWGIATWGGKRTLDKGKGASGWTRRRWMRKKKEAEQQEKRKISI